MERIQDFNEDHHRLFIAAALAVVLLVVGSLGYVAGVGSNVSTRTSTSFVTSTLPGGNTTVTQTTYIQPELLISTTSITGTLTTITQTTTVTWTNTTTVTA